MTHKELKEAFHQARQKSMAMGNSNTVYTKEMLYYLMEMAKTDVRPDGSFGDDDCVIWEWLS